MKLLAGNIRGLARERGDEYMLGFLCANQTSVSADE